MIFKLVSPVIILLKLVLLDHGTHSSVEDQDLLFYNIFNVMFNFVNY